IVRTARGARWLQHAASLENEAVLKMKKLSWAEIQTIDITMETVNGKVRSDVWNLVTSSVTII
ncbi:hypothetical protein FOC4_g10007472, partial [Fusarium odoratissimum]